MSDGPDSSAGETDRAHARVNGRQRQFCRRFCRRPARALRQGRWHRVQRVFVSMAGGEGVAMLTGSPHQVPVVYQVLTWSGASEYVKAEILIPPEEFNANRAMAESLAAHFWAPNQDEIDRMLLEE